MSGRLALKLKNICFMPDLVGLVGLKCTKRNWCRCQSILLLHSISDLKVGSSRTAHEGIFRKINRKDKMLSISSVASLLLALTLVSGARC